MLLNLNFAIKTQIKRKSNCQDEQRNYWSTSTEP